MYNVHRVDLLRSMLKAGYSSLYRYYLCSFGSSLLEGEQLYTIWFIFAPEGSFLMF